MKRSGKVTGFIRSYQGEKQDLRTTGPPKEDEILHFDSSWLTIDGCMSIYTVYSAGTGISVKRYTERNVLIDHHSHNLPSHYVDEICSSVRTDRFRAEKGTLLVDCGFVIQTGMSIDQTRNNWNSNHFTSAAGLGDTTRGMRIHGADGEVYYLLANFGDRKETIHLPVYEDRTAHAAVSYEDVQYHSHNGRFHVGIVPGKAKLLRITR